MRKIQQMNRLFAISFLLVATHPSAEASSSEPGNLDPAPPVTSAASAATSVPAATVVASPASATSPAARSTSAAGGAPNILLLLIDDIGPDQLRCFDPSHGITGLAAGPNLYTGSYPYAPTPNINRLASEGVRFARAYSSPICSPSRAQVQTGRYPFRTGLGGIVTQNARAKPYPHDRQGPDLPVAEYTLPEVLGLFAPSYTPAMFGKWHLSADKCFVAPLVVPDTEGDDHPYLSGWDNYKGVIRNILGVPTPTSEGCIAGRSGYYNYMHVHNAPIPTPYTPCAGAPPGRCVPPNMYSDRSWETEYLVSHELSEVEDFCVNTAEPWCAIWASQAIHGPFDWPPEELHSYGPEPFDLFDIEYWLRYSALLETLDTQIGRLRASLEAEGIWENTLVILMGDNGTDATVMEDVADRYAGIISPYVAPDTGASVRRFKGTPYLSGTSVPLIVSGPLVASPGRVSTELVDAVDVFSTMVDYAGVAASWPSGLGGFTVDGNSLKPAIELSGVVGRTESLGMHFSANGPYLLGSPPFFIELGFIYTSASTDDYYHLVRQQGMTDEFYHLWTTGGVPVDLAEVSDLGTGHAEYAPAVAALDALVVP